MRVVIPSKRRPLSQRSTFIRGTNPTSVTAFQPFRSATQPSPTAWFFDQIFHEQYSIFVASLYAPNRSFCPERCSTPVQNQVFEGPERAEAAGKTVWAPIRYMCWARSGAYFWLILGGAAGECCAANGSEVVFYQRLHGAIPVHVQPTWNARPRLQVGSVETTRARCLLPFCHHTVTAMRLTL
jgi:hypothetical protein